jgi:hypothetical protein
MAHMSIGRNQLFDNCQVQISISAFNERICISTMGDSSNYIVLFYYIPTHYVHFCSDVIPYTKPCAMGAYRLLLLKGDTNKPPSNYYYISMECDSLKQKSSFVTSKDFTSQSFNLHMKAIFTKYKIVGKFDLFVTGFPALHSSLQQYILLQEVMDLKGVLSCLEVYPEMKNMKFLKVLARKWLTTDKRMLADFKDEYTIIHFLEFLDKGIRKEPFPIYIRPDEPRCYYTFLIIRGYEIVVKHYHATFPIATTEQEEEAEDAIIEQLLSHAIENKQIHVIKEILKYWPYSCNLNMFITEIWKKSDEHIELINALFPYLIKNYDSDTINELFDDKFIFRNSANLDILNLLLNYPDGATVRRDIYLETKHQTVKDMLLKHDPTLTSYSI